MRLYREGSRSITWMQGAMLCVEGLRNPFLGELVSVETPEGTWRGEVVGLKDSSCKVHLFDGVSGLRSEVATVWLEGCLPGPLVSERLQGVQVNGFGEVDGQKSFLGEHLPLERPLPPLLSRKLPSRPFETGRGALDLFFPLFMGQVMGLGLSPGLPGEAFLPGLLKDLRIVDGIKPPLTVLAAIGRSRNEASRLISVLREDPDFGEALLVLSSETASASERCATIKTALTVAEYFAFSLERDVVLVALDMEAHEAARRERAEEQGQTPSGTEEAFARLSERCGCRVDTEGTLTFLPVFSCQGRGASPLMEATKSLMQGCWIWNSTGRGSFSLDLENSCSSLISRTGRNVTFTGHRLVADQLRASYLRRRAVRGSTQEDAFIARFDRVFLRARRRFSLARTESVAWRLLTKLPSEELVFLTEPLRRKVQMNKTSSRDDGLLF
ncbi:MAG: hypothetical protein GX256_08695 [Fretibacterium sp.]|nr:hypothetical protein [Fretibacterium sp.]